MMTKLKSKLGGKRGFSLTELLITIVVLALLTVAINVGIGGAGIAYKKITLSSEASVLVSTVSEAVSDELSYATKINVDNGTYRSAVYGSGTKISTDTEGHIVVAAGGTEFQLLNDKTYTSGLQTTIAIDYGYPCRFSLDILDSDGQRITSESFSVMPLNDA